MFILFIWKEITTVEVISGNDWRCLYSLSERKLQLGAEAFLRGCDVYTLYLKGNYNWSRYNNKYRCDVYTLYLKGNYNNSKQSYSRRLMFILFIWKEITTRKGSPSTSSRCLYSLSERKFQQPLQNVTLSRDVYTLYLKGNYNIGKVTQMKIMGIIYVLTNAGYYLNSPHLYKKEE